MSDYSIYEDYRRRDAVKARQEIYKYVHRKRYYMAETPIVMQIDWDEFIVDVYTEQIYEEIQYLRKNELAAKYRARKKKPKKQKKHTDLAAFDP